MLNQIKEYIREIICIIKNYINIMAYLVKDNEENNILFYFSSLR